MALLEVGCPCDNDVFVDQTDEVEMGDNVVVLSREVTSVMGK